jgi:hypothetical protein
MRDFRKAKKGKVFPKSPEWSVVKGKAGSSGHTFFQASVAND